MKNVFLFINCQTAVMKPFWGNSEWFSDTKKLYGPITLHKNIQNIVTNIVTTQISSKYPKKHRFICKQAKMLFRTVAENYSWKLDLHGSLYCLQSEKIISKTNSTFSVMNIPPYPMLWTLCGKLITGKSFLRSATQLKQNIWMKPMKFNQPRDIK